MASSGQALLDGLIVQQADVPKGYVVSVFPGGDQVAGQVTLDLCSASFQSEQLRTARRQVGVLDAAHAGVLSTEAVLYTSPSATQQAFSELRSAKANCPSTFVPGAVQGEPPLKYVFLPLSDSAWPTTRGVDRLVYDAILSDQQGHAEHEIAVYLRRGSLLLGIYFIRPDGPPVSIDGVSTIPGIVTVFARRMARLPATGGV